MAIILNNFIKLNSNVTIRKLILNFYYLIKINLKKNFNSKSFLKIHSKKINLKKIFK